MPVFDTPGPVLVTVDTAAGSVRVNGGDRTGAEGTNAAENQATSEATVRPRDPGSEPDVQAARDTRIEYADGRLLVAVPRSRWRNILGVGPAVEIDVDVPAGSELDVTGWSDVRCTGRLGRVVIDSSLGEIRTERTGRLRIKTSAGDVTVGRVEGHLDVHTSAGTVRVGEVDGTAVVRTSTGELTVGEVTGDLRLNTAMGDIGVDRALASVGAKTAMGTVRIGEVSGGAVVLDTSYGDLEVGVREGVAAWLDARASSGRVRSELGDTEPPGPDDPRVEIRARTQYGDIVVRRA